MTPPTTEKSEPSLGQFAMDAWDRIRAGHSIKKSWEMMTEEVVAEHERRTMLDKQPAKDTSGDQLSEDNLTWKKNALDWQEENRKLRDDLEQARECIRWPSIHSTPQPPEPSPHISPMVLKMLLHFYCICEPLQRLDLHDYTVGEWITDGIIERCSWGYKTTTRGDEWVKAILSVPPPPQPVDGFEKWILSMGYDRFPASSDNRNLMKQAWNAAMAEKGAT